MFDLK